ncbi:type II toxin-antitoxin system VapC family toxin [Myxosarcina sp. GI1]|uniref:type II toxin-antitoxin system VapC family toxin n=1 Tax=Myxosarcina sp. GI1 TaxID=1541065 RepID=UPI0005686027|nr:type II toxin-antitoxin system VapC family toxin [Myxosarcina sp. GI1]
MSYLLDTNVLLRTLITEDSQYQITQTAIASLRRAKERLCIAPQNIIELWNVATRPVERNGLGLSPTETETEVTQLKNLFVLLPDTEYVYLEWERLVSMYRVKGTKVHDTRLVAFALVHQINYILTFNVQDFQRFSAEVTPVNPKKIAESK